MFHRCREDGGNRSKARSKARHKTRDKARDKARIRSDGGSDGRGKDRCDRGWTDKRTRCSGGGTGGIAAAGI